jgi:hypothetical protein
MNGVAMQKMTRKRLNQAKLVFAVDIFTPTELKSLYRLK